jgi:hypothetical protein
VGPNGSLSPFDQNPLAYVGGRVTLAVDEFGFEGIEEPGGWRIYNFAIDSAQPPPDTPNLVENIVAANPDANYIVMGHASRTGTDEHNQTLSELRASAVANALMEAGVDPSNIQRVGGAGEALPVVPGQTDGTESDLDRGVKVFVSNTPDESSGPREVTKEEMFGFFREAYNEARIYSVAASLPISLPASTPTKTVGVAGKVVSGVRKALTDFGKFLEDPFRAMGGRTPQEVQTSIENFGLQAAWEKMNLQLEGRDDVSGPTFEEFSDAYQDFLTNPDESE